MNKLIRNLFALVMFVSASLQLHASYTVVEPQSVLGERYPSAFTNPLLGERRPVVNRVDVARYSATKSLTPISPIMGPKRPSTVKSIGGGLGSADLKSGFSTSSRVNSLSAYPVPVVHIANDGSYMAVTPDASVYISSPFLPDGSLTGDDMTLGGGSEPGGPSTGQLLPIGGGVWILLGLAFAYVLVLFRRKECK